jgi:ribosomal-protein-alanine N-acetyltransferase
LRIQYRSDSPHSITLRSDSLYLRDFELTDWPHVHHYAMDPDVTQYMAWGPNTAEQSLAYTTNAVDNTHASPRMSYELAIIHAETNSLIGGAGLYIKHDRSFEAEIGYCLQKEAWGKGYGTEAARLLVCLGFDHLHLHRLMATCDPENIGSARVLEKNGFQREGLMRSHLKTRYGWRDSYLYAIVMTDERPMC